MMARLRGAPSQRGAPAPCPAGRFRAQTRGHAAHQRPHLPDRPSPADRPRHRGAAGRRQGRPGGAERRRQDHPLPPDFRRDRAGERLGRPAQARAHRPGGAGGAGRTGKPDRGGAGRRPRARAAACRGRDRARPAPHRRNPHAAGRYRFPFGGSARRHHPRRPRLRRGGAEGAVLVVLGRLAHARGAGRDAVHAARPAAARRADQLSRSRRHAVAGDLCRQLSLQRHHHQPRPRPAQSRRRHDRPSRPGQADPLSRQLRFLRSPAARAPGAATEAEGQAGRPAPPSAVLRRPLPRQGVEGQAGAIAHEDAGEDGADRGTRRRHGGALPLSPAGQGRRPADHADGGRVGRL